MDELDAVLPVYVDYLGRFEIEPKILENHEDVMKELLTHGVTDKRFLPGGEITFSNGKMIIKDNIEGVIAERFDLMHVKEPVAFISKDQNPNVKSGFTRVVVFKEVGAGHFNNNDVFHAVQCLESNPQELVEQIQSLNKVSLARMTSKNSLDNNWINNGNDSVRSATVRRQGPAIPQYQPNRPIPVALPLVTKETDKALLFDQPRRQYETSDDPVEKYTILLNLCIEDIERFCADVKAAKDQQLGMIQRGVSSLQANDYVRVFQKFKLAFNLLGALQNHIKDPDASEILHHLFPPLAFLIDECFDQFGEDLVKDVLAPLMTRTAVRFLGQTLNNREKVIWEALGDYWRQPRNNWKGDIPPYRPIFHGGWSPGIVKIMDEDDITEANLYRRESDRSKKTSSVSSDENAKQSQKPPPPQQPLLTPFDEFRDDLMARKARIALVVFGRERKNNKELTTVKGEYLQVLENDRKWWKCKNREGEVGFVPNTLLKAIIYTDTFDDYEDRMKYQNIKRHSSKKGRRSTASSSDESELESSPNQVRAAPPVPPPVPVLAMVQQEDRRPVAPRPQPKPKMPYSSSTGSIRSMQEELKDVLDIYKERKDKVINIHTTPEAYITQKSTPHEVREWLKVKQFSQRAIDQLGGMHGGDLFAMSRDDLIAAFGKTEGKRLDGQITICRNTAGYKTARSSELKAILEKARKKAEKAQMEEEDSDSDDQVPNSKA